MQDDGTKEIEKQNEGGFKNDDNLLPLITSDYNSDRDEEDEEEMPKKPRYNLRQSVRASANRVIFKESPNVVTSEGEAVHAGRFSLATKILCICKAYKAKMYTPVGVFAGAVFDPDTGKCLEYCNCRRQQG